MNTTNSSALRPDVNSGSMASNLGMGNIGLKLLDKAETGAIRSKQWSLDLLSRNKGIDPFFAVKASIRNEGQSTNLQLISSEAQSRILLNPDGSIELGHSWSQQIFDVFQQSLSKVDSLIADAIQRLSDSWASLSSPSETGAETPTSLPSNGISETDSSNNLSSNSPDKLPNLRKPKTLPKMGDFLWKPVAEKDGKLVVLLPSKLTGDVNRVRLLSPDGKQVIAQSRFSGIGNGNRGHYRFPKPGAEYPSNTKVEVIMDNGTRFRVNIPSTGKRVTR